MHRLLLLSILGLIHLGAAETSPEAVAEQRFLAALARAPAIVAARTAALAAERAQAAAGVLPDPMLGLDAGRERLRQGETMTMYGAMIEQPLPRWGERDAMRLSARAQTAGSWAVHARIVGEHAAGVATAVAEWTAARDTLELVRQSRARVDALREVVRAGVAAGGAMLDQQLELDSRAQQLDLRLADLIRRQADAQAEVQGRLGLPAEAGMPPFAAPDPATILPEADPMARAAAAMALDAQAMEREAVARGNPETVLGLAWGREAAGTEMQSDSISLSLRVSLPIHRAAYRAAAEAARSRARAARHEADGAVWMARSRIGRAQRAAVQATLAETAAADIASRMHSAYEVAIRQVGTGTASVTVALDQLDRISEAGMDAIMARLDSRMALADLWRLAPPDLPESTAAADHHQPRTTAP